MSNKLFHIYFSITLLLTFFDSNLSASNNIKSEIDEVEKKIVLSEEVQKTIVLSKRDLYQKSKSSKGQLFDLHKLPEAAKGAIYKGRFYVLPKDVLDSIIRLSSFIKFRSLNTLCNYYVTGIPKKYIGNYARDIQPEHKKFFKKYKKFKLVPFHLKEVPNFILTNVELNLSLDAISLNDVVYINKLKFINSLVINEKFDNSNINLLNIKEKLMMFITKNNHIQNLTIFESCFDVECVKEISKKGVITTLSVRKYMDSAFNDDFAEALANIPQLKKLELTTSATPQQLTLMTNHPTLEYLAILPIKIDYDQIMSFLNMPKLKYLYSLTEVFTTEQIQELQKVANLRNIELDLREGPKKL